MPRFKISIKTIKENRGVSADVARFIQSVINGKFKALYVEASPAKCQTLKENGTLTHLDWDAELNQMISSNMNILTEECEKIGAKATIDEGGVKILVPILEADAEDFGASDVNAPSAGTVHDERDLEELTDSEEKYATKEDLDQIKKDMQDKLNKFFAEKKFVTEKELQAALDNLRVRS